VAVEQRTEAVAPPAAAPAPTATEPAVSAGRWRVLGPGSLFVGVRVVGLLVLAWQSWANGEQLVGRLTRWDGQWLLGIADGGYGHVPLGLVDAFGRRTAATPLAFFPGYPFAVAGVRFVTDAGLIASGLVVSLLAAVALAHGLARLGELVPGGSRRAGLILVVLVAAAPMGVVWSMTYSEGLFCACAVWALVFLLRAEWVFAGLACAAAGLVRPTGFALLAAVGLAGLVALWRHHESWRACRRPVAGLLIAPLGLLGYLGFVAARTGSPMGWFALQRHGWNSRFDGGRATLRFTADVLATGRSVLEVITVAVLAGAVVLFVLCIRRRRSVPWPLTVYAAGVLLMDLGANGLMNSKARLLLPAFTLLVPVALGLAERRRGTVLGVLTAAVLASAWFGGYALTGWPYAI
jgi:hypothetical protein